MPANSFINQNYSKTGLEDEDEAHMDEETGMVIPKEVVPQWSKITAYGNSLKDCHQFYTKKPPLKKDTRDIFVKGSLDEVVHDFQKLMDYCAQDVQATYEVFDKVYEKFRKHCQVGAFILLYFHKLWKIYYVLTLL